MFTTESYKNHTTQSETAGAIGWIVKLFHPDSLLIMLEQVTL